MNTHDLIVIGGSTGAQGVLRQVFSDFDAELAASLLVVTHIASNSGNLLASILDAAGPIKVVTAADGDPIEQGRAYVGPAGSHLLVDQGAIRLGHGPRENMVRPAADALFRSAAVSYGPRVIGVVLSGLLDDGAAGLAAVKRCGGTTVVQDPADALANEMPVGALSASDIDYRVTGSRMAQALLELSREPAQEPGPVPADIAWEVSIAMGRPSTTEDLTRVATPVALACPGCGGVLSQLHQPDVLRFRCQIGHAYTAEALDKEHEAAVMHSLGMALRILEERHTLLTKMSADARRKGRELSARQFEERAAEFREQANALRQAIVPMP